MNFCNRKDENILHSFVLDDNVFTFEGTDKNYGFALPLDTNSSFSFNTDEKLKGDAFGTKDGKNIFGFDGDFCFGKTEDKKDKKLDVFAFGGLDQTSNFGSRTDKKDEKDKKEGAFGFGGFSFGGTEEEEEGEEEEREEFKLNFKHDRITSSELDDIKNELEKKSKLLIEKENENYNLMAKIKRKKLKIQKLKNIIEENEQNNHEVLQELERSNSKIKNLNQTISDKEMIILEKDFKHNENKKEIKRQRDIIEKKSYDLILSEISKEMINLNSQKFENFTNFYASIQTKMKILNNFSKYTHQRVFKCIQDFNENLLENIEFEADAREEKRKELIEEITIKLNEMNKKMEQLKLHHMASISTGNGDLQKYQEFLNLTKRLKEMMEDFKLILRNIPNYRKNMVKKLQVFYLSKEQIDDQETKIMIEENNINIEILQKRIKKEDKNKFLDKIKTKKTELQLLKMKFENDKIEFKKELIDYPELMLKLEFEQENTVIQWLNSVNLYQDISMDYFKVSRQIQFHISIYTNLSGEYKVLKRLLISDEKYKNEINMLMSLSHPYIIKPELCFLDKDEYIVLQFPYYPQNLKDWIENKKISEKRIFFQKLIHAFHYIHSKFIIHRDIKFDNILIHENNPMIIDFGIAKKIVSQISQTGTKLVGTSHFMAPELFQKASASYESDVWSFGVLLYESFYGIGSFGFQKKDEIEFKSIYGDDNGLIVDLLKKILKINPKERPTFNELLLDPFFMVNVEKKLFESKKIIEKDEKIKNFISNLPEIMSHTIDIKLKRENIVSEVIEFFKDDINLMYRIYVSFQDEFVIDLGGATVEMFVLFFSEISKDLKHFKSFETCYLLPSDEEEVENENIYYVVGKLMVKALIHKIPIPVPFPSSFYRFILDDDADYDHLYKESYELDPIWAKNIHSLSEKDDLSWISVEDEVHLGKKYNFSPKDLQNQQNLKQYKMYQYKTKIISNEYQLKRMELIKKGFKSVELNLLKKLTSYELQEIIAGNNDLNAQEIWNQFHVSSQWNDDDDSICFLQQLLFEMTSSELRDLLKWMTGLISLPIHGLSKKIEINPSEIFYAHTCQTVLSFELKRGYKIYEDFKKDFMNHLEYAKKCGFLE